MRTPMIGQELRNITNLLGRTAIFVKLRSRSKSGEGQELG